MLECSLWYCINSLSLGVQCYFIGWEPSVAVPSTFSPQRSSLPCAFNFSETSGTKLFVVQITSLRQV